MKNNPHGRFKTLINNNLLFNQSHVMNHFLKPLICLMRLRQPKKTSIDQVIYYVYFNDKHMEEHAPNIDNADILTPEVHQVPNLDDDNEVDHDTLDPGSEDGYYGYDDEDCGEDSDT